VFRNPHHFKEFKHKHLATMLLDPKASTSQDHSESLKEQLKIYSDIEKLLNRPQNVELEQSSVEISLAHDKNPSGKYSENVGEKRPHSPEDSAATAAKKMAPNVPRGKSRIVTKLEAAAPFNFLLTKIKDEPSTHNDSHR